MAAESGDICLPAATRQPFAREEEPFPRKEELVQQFSASQKECLRCKWSACPTYGITTVAMATTCGMFYVVP